ncbi:hypothetical protein QM565_09295 [Geitlerinema splendidum]|nr:hypothetical protein [Geitlerinema splendidum]
MAVINLTPGVNENIPSSGPGGLTTGIDTIVVPSGPTSNDIINGFQAQDLINLTAFPGLDYYELSRTSISESPFPSGIFNLSRPSDFGNIRFQNGIPLSALNPTTNFITRGKIVNLVAGVNETIPFEGPNSLTSGIGAVDTIVVPAGASSNDIINRFEQQDRIDLSAFPSLVFSNLTITRAGADVIIGNASTFGNIRLVDFPGTVTADNFIFAGGGADITPPSTPRPLDAEAFVISRDAANPTTEVIGSVRATDNVGVTGYELVGAPANFSISNDGLISVTNAPSLPAGSIQLQVRARDAANNLSATPGTVTVFTSIQDAVNSNLVLGDGVDNSFIDPITGNSTGLGTIRVARGTYQPVALYEKPDAGPLRLLGPNAGVAGTGTRQPEAVIGGSGIFLVGGITDGLVVDGFEINGGRVQLFDDNPSTGSSRNNLAFRNNIFRNNPSSDPTIQLESPPNGATSNTILIENNWFDNINIGARQPFQAVPQAIKINNANNITIRNNRINDYGPGAQGFGVLMQYGIGGTRTITGNTFERIGIAPVSILGDTTVPGGNTVIP